MAQTSQGQAAAQKKWANTAMGTQRKNERALGKGSPKVSVGYTKTPQAALNENRKIATIKGSSPASRAGLGQPTPKN